MAEGPERNLPPWATQWVSPDLQAPHHYNSAPITEAVIEVRFHSVMAPALDILKSFVDDLEGWAGAEVKQLLSGSVELREDGEAAASTQSVGFQVTKQDKSRSLQILPDRIAFAWESQYQDWPSFVSEWWSVWEPYARAVDPQIVTRVATRFVNLIRVPKPQIEITDYLRTAVNISPVLPQAVRALFMQVDVPLVASGELGTLITSTLAEPEEAGTSLIVLDLDTYDQGPFAGSDLKQQIFEKLERLRQAKNYVFEASITDATRGLIA